MCENPSIGKEFEASTKGLTAESSSATGMQVPKPAYTEYTIEGNRLVTTRIYYNPTVQSDIWDCGPNGSEGNPASYRNELMDEFLSIGQKYEAVEYPSSKVLENTENYQKDPQDRSSDKIVKGDQDNFSDDSQEEDNSYPESYNQCDYDYLNQEGTYNKHSNEEEGPVGDHDNVLANKGITVDHGGSEGAQHNTAKTFPKAVYPQLRKGLDSEIPRHEQPREKALRLGIEALSDAELLALIFGTGIKGQNVLEMSRQILSDNMNHLSLLARLSPQELTMRYKGIGQAKAIMLCAAMALGIRAERDAHSNQMQQIDSSLKAYNLLRPQLQWIEHEEFWVIYLTKSNNLKNCCCISRGGISETVVDVRMVIQRALQESASAIILVHNHPGSLLLPSHQDDELTIKIAEAARFFDIEVLDHIIIGATGYYSYLEHNHMKF